MLQILLRPNQNTAAARQNTHYNRRNAGNSTVKPENYTGASPPPSPTGYTGGEGSGSDWQGVTALEYYSLKGKGNRGIQKGFMMTHFNFERCTPSIPNYAAYFFVKVKLY
jgi:hypothetical protein